MAKTVLQALMARLRGLLLATAASGLAATAPASAQDDPDTAAWESARQAGTFDAYQGYLQNFPTGQHADEAFKTMVDLAAGNDAAAGPVRGVNATLY